MRNGEGGRGKGGATMNVPFTIARCREVMPKIDKLKIEVYYLAVGRKI